MEVAPKWPPNQEDSSNAPAATATPLYIPPPSSVSVSAFDQPPAEKVTPIEDVPCCIDKNKRMSICSEEVCQLSEDKKKAMQGGNLVSLSEEGDRPDSPIPFGKTGGDSAETTPIKEEMKSFALSATNVNFEEKKDGGNITQTRTAEALQASAQEGKSSSQSVQHTIEDGGVHRTRTVKTEESFSHSSTAYSSVKSTKSLRAITPEICEIMDKPRGSPAILPPEFDRPATPSQVVVFPPEMPAHYPLPRSRACTPQPHALQRILSEELGVKPIQPPIPIEEVIAVSASSAETVKAKEESSVSKSVKIEELFTKTQVDEIVQQELTKFKNDESISKQSTGSLKEATKQVDLKEVSAFSATQKESSSIFSSDKIQQQQQSFSQPLPVRPISPVQPPRTIIRPKPQPVPLPPETTPYYPPPAPPALSEEEQKSEMLQYRNLACQSPMVSALTTAPNRPYSPLPAPKIPAFKPIGLDDLPPPPSGGQPMSLLSALTIAPDHPYSPFPEPVDVSKKSPPKFQKWQEQQQGFEQQQQHQQISCPKPLSAVKPSTQQPTNLNQNVSAFKPISQPKPLPLPLPEQPKPAPQASKTTKSFQSTSDEVQTIFRTEAQSASQHISAPKHDTRSISPSGLSKPALLPYYQQNIGEIPLAHRAQSPVPHTIKAPTFKNVPAPQAESKISVSEQVKRSSSVSSGYVTSSSASSSFASTGTGGYGYVPSSLFGKTFTANKEDSTQRAKSASSQGSEQLLPYYQQNIGEIPLAHRPKSPVPHAIKAPSTNQPPLQARASPTTVRPSPLAGKAPELSKSKQVFKPEVKSYQNVFTAPPEPPKTLQKTLPHFTAPKSVDEPTPSGAPWFVKKIESAAASSTSISSSSSTSTVRKDESSFMSSKSLVSAASVPPPKLPTTNFSQKLASLAQKQPTPSQKAPSQPAPAPSKQAAGFTPPNQSNKPVGAPTTSVPPTGAGGAGAPGNKGATFAGSTAPKRGRGTMNPGVGPGARIPLCGSCNRQIRGPFITALGKIWCPEHFICANAQCKRPLQDIGFVEESSGLYCEFCFEQFLAPVCSKCSAKIKGDCLNAIGKHFHPECFCCAYCGKLFGNSPFFLEDALPYCENDWNELFTTKCFSCGFPIEAGDRWVEALSNNYHSQCFNCTMCKKNLEGQSFYAKGGRPFCKNHAR